MKIPFPPVVVPVLLGILLIMGGCGSPPGEHPAGDAASPDAAAPGVAIPELVLDTIDGERFDLSARRGEWVVVNFWATWCRPCLKEIPDLSELHDSRSDLMVIGLAYEEIELDAMHAFLERIPASYPIAIIDPYAARPAGDFDTPRGLPMTYLIAPDGLIAKRFLGPVTSGDIIEALQAHSLD